MKNLFLSTIVSILALAAAHAQAFVANDATFTPVATVNSVWPTKTDRGQAVGSIYARGLTPECVSLEWLSLGGDRIYWAFSGGLLHFAPQSAPGAFSQGFYLKAPTGPGQLALQIRPNIGPSTSITLGALTAKWGQTIIVPLAAVNAGAFYGTVEFPTTITSQAQFRLVRYIPN